MSAPRAGDWHLLGHDSDPVPASPYEVSSEGTHYTTVASTIADQITRLEALAADDAARAFTQRVLPSTTRMEALRVGADHSLAALAKDHRLLVQELGEAAIDPAFSRNLSRAVNFTIANQATNIPLVLNPKIGPHKVWNAPGWSHLQDATTVTIGGPF